MKRIEGYHLISVDHNQTIDIIPAVNFMLNFNGRKLPQAGVRHCSGNWLGTSYSQSNVVTFSPWKEKKWHIVT